MSDELERKVDAMILAWRSEKLPRPASAAHFLHESMAALRRHVLALVSEQDRLQVEVSKLLELFEQLKTTAPENFHVGLPCAVWDHIDGPLRRAYGSLTAPPSPSPSPAPCPEASSAAGRTPSPGA